MMLPRKSNIIKNHSNFITRILGYKKKALFLRVENFYVENVGPIPIISVATCEDNLI